MLSYELSTVSDVCLYVDACIMRMGVGGLKELVSTIFSVKTMSVFYNFKGQTQSLC